MPGAAGCGGAGNGQVAVSGEDYEYHFYNTQTAATEHYLINQGWLIPRADETRLDGNYYLADWEYGFDIGGDTLFFTQEDRLYSIKLEDAVSRAVAGKPLTEGLTPALEGFGYPKYYDGKLYVSNLMFAMDSIADLCSLENHTTSVYDVTSSPWRLLGQKQRDVYPGADPLGLPQEKIHLEDREEWAEMESAGMALNRDPGELSTFITNYDENWIYYMPIYGYGVYRTPYSDTEFNEEQQEDISGYFDRLSNFEIDIRDLYFDMIDGQIYFAGAHGYTYRVNSDDLSEIHVVK